jgi:hypothetical protein
MLKEVGASGQISLGKKYAGQLFDLQTAEDGSLKLTPVKVVPANHVANETQAPYGQPRQTATKEWAEAHVTEIEQYNAWASQREPYSQRVRRWRESGL